MTLTVTDKSKATIRVREQLVGVSLPSDALLTAMGAKGSFELNADGTFESGSKITFDLTTLSSDERDRDNFIKNDSLQVRQFPTAGFVPTKTSGLVLPLATSGTFTFTLTGNITIRGKTKEVTFDVTAKRDGSDLTATATANPSWKFGDFGMTAPSVPRAQRDRRDPRIDRYRRDRPQGISPRAAVGGRSSAPRAPHALNANTTDGTRSATDSTAIRS